MTYGTSPPYGLPSVRSFSSPASRLAGHRAAPSVTPGSCPKSGENAGLCPTPTNASWANPIPVWAHLSSYEGDRFVESMRYARTYPAELPALRDLLPQVQTPVQIIAGGRDSAVPPVNAEFLHERLPHSKLDIIDAGHFTWEDGADQYAALVTTWWNGGYTAT